MFTIPSWLVDLADETPLLEFLAQDLTMQDVEEMLLAEGRHEPEGWKPPTQVFRSLFLEDGPEFPEIPPEHDADIFHCLLYYGGFHPTISRREHLMKALACYIVLRTCSWPDFGDGCISGLVKAMESLQGEGAVPSIRFLLWHALQVRDFQPSLGLDHLIALASLLAIPLRAISPMVSDALREEREHTIRAMAGARITGFTPTCPPSRLGRLDRSVAPVGI